MKKAIKTTLSILICLIYTAMLLPAAYAAGESLSLVADKITAELFTQNEPDYALTKNIYFDPALLPVPDGCTVEFSSSDSSVIEVVNVDATESSHAYQYGKVIRDKYSDKEAVITMTLSDGTETVKKDFEFTVASLATKIYYSDTFRYPGHAGKFVYEVPGLKSTTPVRYTPSLTYGVGWQSLYTTEFDDETVNGRRFRTLLDNTDNNYSLRAERKFAAEEYNYTRYVFGDKPDGKTELSMRLKMDETQLPQIYIFHLWGTFIDENGSTIRRQVLEMQLQRRSDGHYLSASNATGEKSESYIEVRPENGEWFKLTMTIDVKNQTYDLYYNDEKLNEKSHNFYMKYDESLKIVNLNDFQFNVYRKNPGGCFYLDDMVVRTDSHFLEKNKHLYELRDEIILDTVMIENDGEFNSQGIDSDITIDYSKTDAQNLINSHNISVEWLSDNEDVLSVNGNTINVTKPNLDTKVTLTAKIIDNYTGDFIEENYEAKVICDEATREINEVYNALTAERLTTQVLTAVTDDFSLPEFENVNIQWISNSKHLTNDGKVTRGDEDINVILSAIISKDETSFTARKSFDITILAKGKKVYSADNLYYPGKEGLELNEAGIYYWSNENASQSNRYTNTITVDEDYNYVMASERAEANSKDYNFTKHSLKTAIQKKGEVSFRFKLLHTQKPQLYIFQLFGETRNENNSLSTKQAVEVKIEYTGSGGYIKSASPEVYVLNGELETKRWYTMKIAFDNGKKVYDVYLDGEKLNDAPIDYFNNLAGVTDINQIDFVNMTTFRYNGYREKSGAKLYVDDICAVGYESIEMQTVLYDDGIYRTTDATGVITGSADGKLYIYNPDGQTKEGTAVLAAFDNGKLIWTKMQNVSFSASRRAVILKYEDLDIPFSGNVEVKSYFFGKGNLSPKTDEAVINNSLQEMKPVIMYDSNTGNEYKVLNMFGENIMRCYYTMQCTSADGTKLYFHDADFNLYEYDMVMEKGRFLDRLLNDYTIVTSPLGNVFYVNKDREIIKMDCVTCEKSLVTKIPEDYSTGKVSMIQVNNDESLISVEWSDLKIEPWEDGDYHESRFPVYNLVTGEWMLDITYGFDTPWYAPNHKSINPNPEMGHLELFAHEGEHVKDRVWVMNLETGVPYNVFVQKPYSETESGESAGHEGWTYDGKHVFFVGGASRIGGYSGFTWVGYDGKDRRYITEGAFCHVGIHPYTDRWAIADTSYNGTDSTITLIDCWTGDKYPVATVHQTGVDPGHCHPNFSFDGKTAIFGMYDSNDTISIGWADVSRYIDEAPEVHKYNLSENCTIETAERAEKDEPKKINKNGVTSYHIPADGIMRVQYRGEEIESTAADITVKYLDEGTESIIIEYFVWTTGETNKLVRHTAEIPCTDSGKWIEKTIRIEDINLENMELLEGDFVIRGGTKGAYIESISVALRKEVSEEELHSVLSFEKICSEPMDMITKDLNLPLTLGKDNTAILWESSDESVISNDGKVTRNLAEAKNVTLTATVPEALNFVSVQYNLTVLPSTYNVYKVQNFYYPDDDKLNPVLSGSFINSPNGKTLSVEQDGNYYASFDFGEGGLASGNSASASLYDGANRHQTVYLYTKIKLSGESKNGIDLRTTIRNASTNAVYGNSITVARIKGNNIYTNTGSKLAGSLSSTEFTPVIFKVDLLTSAGAIKVGSGDWVEINSFESSYTYPTDGTKHMLGALNFVRAGSSTPEGILMISEAAAYTEVNE